MKKTLSLGVFVLSALVWAGAQQPNSMPAQSGAQSTTPGAAQSQPGTQPGMPGATTPGTDQAPTATPQAGTAGTSANGPVTEGCLGGTNPNFTLTDAAGKTYKLNLPAGADGSRLTSHVGESVQVMGEVKSNTIDVSKVGKGNSACPAK